MACNSRLFRSIHTCCTTLTAHLSCHNVTHEGRVVLQHVLQLIAVLVQAGYGLGACGAITGHLLLQELVLLHQRLVDVETCLVNVWGCHLLQ